MSHCQIGNPESFLSSFGAHVGLKKNLISKYHSFTHLIPYIMMEGKTDSSPPDCDWLVSRVTFPRTLIHYTPVALFLGGKATMKFWKIAALVALASIPLLLMSSKKKVQEPVYGDTDNIFENELSAD